jgi:hypothetical protein
VKVLCIVILVAIFAPHLPWYMAFIACVAINALLNDDASPSQSHEPSSSPCPAIVLVP